MEYLVILFSKGLLQKIKQQEKQRTANGGDGLANR